MAHDFRIPRLYVEAPLAAGAGFPLDRGQTNYLLNVLRRKTGDPVLVFNGRDGEWRARLDAVGRKGAKLVLDEQSRPQTMPGDLHYLFAPLKQARLDYLVQKAVELGVSRLVPVLTRHGQIARVNLDRMRANAVEAAEQCGILNVPEIAGPVALDRLLKKWVPDRLMVFCDEEAPVHDPVALLEQARDTTPPALAVTVLVGPEGGFAEDERAALRKLPNLVRLSLGPRILRADTAAVAVLTLVQAILGDWR
jgi:16S rRNA (uracil1498-N3)-methyltransferase